MEAYRGRVFCFAGGYDVPIKLIRVKGSPFWYARGSCCGKKIYESTGLSDLKLAEAYRVSIESQIQDAHAFGRKDSIIFAEAAQMYLNSGGSKEYLKPLVLAIGRNPVEALKQSDIDALALKLYPTQSPATRNRQAYTPFIAVMNYAAENDYCGFRKWRRPKAGEKVRKSRAAEPEEIARMYHAAAKHIKPLIVLLALTGLRMGEALALQWEDVNLEKKWLIVKKSKTGRSRGVPMHNALIHELSKVHPSKRTGSVIKTQSMKAYRRSYRGGNMARKARNTAAEKANIGRITWHDLRHTCATWLQRAGIARETRQDILGHSRGAVHDTYIHVPSNALIDAIQTLPDFTLFQHSSDSVS